MNRRSVLLSTLTMIMLCVLSPPNELHAAGQGAGERVVLDKITLKSWPRWLAKVPPAATSLPHRWYVLDLYAWGCAKVNKSGTGLSPEAYIFSKEGQIAFTDDPENFRLTLFVKCASLPGVCFRYWHWKEKYRFDVMEGTLTKYAQGKERVLATASSPVFTEAERNGPKPWKLLEITAREGQFRIRLSGDGRKWRTIIQCVDRDLIEGGVISLEVIRQISRTPACFGDIEIASLGGGRGAAARAPGADELRRRLLPLAEYSKHCFSGGGNADARIEGFRLLDSLSPASARHPTIRLALASVLSEQMTRTKASRDAFRLHALRMVRKLKLKIDFAAELLRAVTHEDLGFQFGAIDALNRLKLKPEQLFSRAVDGLLLDDRFHRDNVGLLIHAGGEPLKKLVIKEIERRLAGATDKDQRKRLLRALFRDPLSLPVLLKALDDPAPEVRQMALHSLRFLDGPLAWKWERVKSVFSQAPEITKKITAKVQAMLQSDPSVACRAEAAGCLAQMRQAPKLLIAALADGESEVRAMAVQGLCNFRPQELAPAIGELERLKDDPRCGRDAAATLEYARSEDPKVENPEETFDVTKLTPEQLLAETSRRGRLAARKTLELDAEKLPWYLDVMSHMSALLCLGRNRDATDELLKRSISYYAYGKKGSLTQARLAAVYALHNSRSRSHPGGRFSAETEALYKKSMFSYVDWNSLRFDGFVNEVEA
ncbi:MAG: HEAT repeat domain-containing protein, partial [Planctomycetota bacterium]